MGVRHKQVCTRVDSEGQKNLPLPCPAGGSNPGSSGFNSDTLTTELRAPLDPGFLRCTLPSSLLYGNCTASSVPWVRTESTWDTCADLPSAQILLEQLRYFAGMGIVLGSADFRYFLIDFQRKIKFSEAKKKSIKKKKNL